MSNFQYPKLRFDENHKPYIVDDFYLNINRTLYDSNTYTPIINIDFNWTPEMQQDLIAHQNGEYNVAYELLAEKLKQSFLKLLKDYIYDVETVSDILNENHKVEINNVINKYKNININFETMDDHTANLMFDELNIINQKYLKLLNRDFN